MQKLWVTWFNNVMDRAGRSEHLTWGELCQVLDRPPVECRNTDAARVKDFKVYGSPCLFQARSTDGDHTNQSGVDFSLICFDLDKCEPGAMDRLIQWVTWSGHTGCVYTTFSHTPSAPRLRLILPIERPCTKTEYLATRARTRARLEVGGFVFDNTDDPARVAFYGTCANGGGADWEFWQREGVSVPPVEVVGFFDASETAAGLPPLEPVAGQLHNTLRAHLASAANRGAVQATYLEACNKLGIDPELDKGARGLLTWALGLEARPVAGTEDQDIADVVWAKHGADIKYDEAGQGYAWADGWKEDDWSVLISDAVRGVLRGYAEGSVESTKQVQAKHQGQLLRHAELCRIAPSKRTVDERMQLEECEQTQKLVKSMGNKTARFRSARAYTDVLKLARGDSRYRTASGTWTAPANLLGVQNGVVDLTTGSLRPYAREDRVLQRTVCNYDPTATAPQWERFLVDILPEQAVREYVHRLLGYALWGAQVEHLLPIFWGDGGNGKGTLLNTVYYVLGDYATQLDAEILLATRNPSGEDRHSITGLVGKRLVIASETGRERELNEARIKTLTGNDPITGRRHHQKAFRFIPVFTLILATNHKPDVTGTDAGIKRRVRMVPFTMNKPLHELDRHLPDKLRAETCGILNWLVQGCLAWQLRGLDEPEAVTQATTVFRAQSIGKDGIEEWVNMNFDTPGQGFVKGTDLLRGYTQFCRDVGIPQRYRSGMALAEAMGRIPGLRSGIRAGYPGVYGLEPKPLAAGK